MSEPDPSSLPPQPSLVGCHLCQHTIMTGAPDFASHYRVTSDCQPFPAGGMVHCCTRCGTIQKNPDRHWQAETRQIYAAYQIYAQTGSGEHPVFESQGHIINRSEKLLHNLLQAVPLPASGSLLDIGCGNGSLLESFSRIQPDWQLYGTEWNDQHRRTIEAIPGVKGFFVGDPEQAPGRFDLITVVHVLEHVPNPVAFLRRLMPKLTPNGILFVQVPNLRRNPFDLVVADHCTHFTAATLRPVLAASGFTIRHLTNRWVTKELSLIAQPARNDVQNPDAGESVAQQKSLFHDSLTWLQKASRAICHVEGKPLALFGTSIAATWMFQERTRVGDIDFFVDEDPRQFGRHHLGRPIRSLDIPVGTTLFMPFLPEQSAPIVQRLSKPQWRFVVLPAMPSGGQEIF
ncbi:MAG: class I SAM-dependent methyltransferase [Magnetococcales bacterium]|nr:class I SAM-dependent methyltransferase [Magnetococcales bacterium]